MAAIRDVVPAEQDSECRVGSGGFALGAILSARYPDTTSAPRGREGALSAEPTSELNKHVAMYEKRHKREEK
jgi:hypothetical protein